MSREVGNRHQIAQTLFNLSMIQTHIGNYSASIIGLKEVLQLDQEMGFDLEQVDVLIALAEVYATIGNYTQALHYLHTIDRAVPMKEKLFELEYLNVDGLIKHEQFELSEALAAYNLMADLARKAVAPYYLAQSHLGLSRSYLSLNDAESLAGARFHSTEALAICKKLDLAGLKPRAYAYLSKADWLLNNSETAIQNCHKAMLLLEVQKHVHGSEAEVFLIAIQLTAAIGQSDEHRKYLYLAHQFVQSTTANLQDEPLRHRYLAIPANRDVVALYKKWGDDSP